jgi:hypothetical protein
MSELPDEERERVLVAQREADALGYRLLIEEALNIEPVTHMSIGYPIVQSQVSMGRWLAYGKSAGEAAQDGVDVLKGIVERGDPWPDEPG